MTTKMRDFNFTEVPKFVKLIEANHGVHSVKVSDIKDIIEEVFVVSVQRGLTDEEFSLLLRLFYKGPLSKNDKLKLLKNLVPEKTVPKTAIEQFIVWFISNLQENTFDVTTSPRILQWIIGLLEHNFVDSREINNFYFEFLNMLAVPCLMPYVAKLLCKLTKPDDVNSQTVMAVLESSYDSNNKYILAVLNVFQGYKPHLVPEDVKKVNVVKVLASVNKSMDSVMTVRVINSCPRQSPTKALGVYEVPTRNFSCFKDESNRTSSLIPLPTYNLEGMNKCEAYYPNSVEEAFKNFNRVPLPQNIMSLLQDDAGFFTISYRGIEEQMRFQNRLLQTLQSALIYVEIKPSEEDVKFLLRRVYSLQAFMVQGIHAVSVFLSGYLLNWDGLDYRYHILKLIEFATFHSFKELANNILRPLHMVFITNNVNMKKEIIQTLVNLIRHMFLDALRTRQGSPYPFMRRGPKWTKRETAVDMLQSLVNWTEELIMLGLDSEQDSTILLMEAIRFYEIINSFEVTSCSPMFTVVSERVLLKSLLSQQPHAIIRICRLLLRYHQEILPKLRLEQPHFYEYCKEKISCTSNYAQHVIYFLQNGQVVPPRKENGLFTREVPTENLASGGESFSLTNHTCFVSTFVSFESNKNLLNLLIPGERRAAIELASVHLKYITKFMDYFSPSQIPELS